MASLTHDFEFTKQFLQYRPRVNAHLLDYHRICRRSPNQLAGWLSCHLLPILRYPRPFSFLRWWIPEGYPMIAQLNRSMRSPINPLRCRHMWLAGTFGTSNIPLKRSKMRFLAAQIIEKNGGIFRQAMFDDQPVGQADIAPFRGMLLGLFFAPRTSKFWLENRHFLRGVSWHYI